MIVAKDGAPPCPLFLVPGLRKLEKWSESVYLERLADQQGSSSCGEVAAMELGMKDLGTSLDSVFKLQVMILNGRV